MMQASARTSPARTGTLVERLRARLERAAPAIVCVGLSAWDLTWEVPALPAPGAKVRATNFRDGGGGMAANAAVAVARLGGRARFWSRAGDDVTGRAMHAELAALGVDVAAFRLFEGAHSSVSGIIVDAAGERSIVNFRGAGLPDDPSWLPLAEVAQAAAVLADPRWPDAAEAAYVAARAAGIPTVLDGDVADREVFDRLLPRVDCAVFSESGLAGYASGEADPQAQLQQALRGGCRIAAVTLGAQGLWWSDGAEAHQIPAHAVEAVDTTGAGDVFHGALALALGAGLDIADALRFSAAVAALKCTRPGGRGGIPALGAVLSFLNECKEN
jgi:sulfofructose kinase